MQSCRYLRWLAFLSLLLVITPLWSQSLLDEAQQNEVLSFVGLKLDDLMMRFGIPQTVHAVRGEEYWQDDVVFVYSEGDFYIYRDRVWQIGLRSAFGLNIGDPKAVALLTFGDNAQDNGDFILYPLSGHNWPLSLRVNISANRISNIFVYRRDF